MTFAERECRDKSPLYFHLAQQIAEDEELLRLCAISRERQPVPNLFLAAVHDLILQHPEEEIAAFYPSVSGSPGREIPFPIFREFVHQNSEKIRDTLATRMVQTNAVNRSAYLMPIISSLFDDEELAVVDIGTSSGLVLNYDQYQYRYDEDTIFGDSPVKIQSSIKSGQLPPFRRIKQPSRKIGIDQNVLDLRRPDNARWLKALIWPDLTDRFDRLSRAIEAMLRTDNVSLREGSSPEDFAAILETIPKSEALFLYHTHVLYQFTPSERSAFRDMVNTLGNHRDLHYLAVEANSIFDNPRYREPAILMELNTYRNGALDKRVLGRVDGHGRWVKWAES
nr:DUF2332 domain-containing protein [Lewinella sp. W8]